MSTSIPGPTFDRGGYPTDETLERIAYWPRNRCAELLEFVASAWHTKHGVSWELKEHERELVGSDGGGRYLRLVTGGWSGDEQIISAFRENYIAWYATWRLSAVGGLHIFKATAVELGALS